jgi:hypothetical protein
MHVITQEAWRELDSKNLTLRQLNGVKRSVPGNRALIRLAKFRKVLLLQRPLGASYDRLTLVTELGICHRVHQLVEGDIPDIAERAANLVLRFLIPESGTRRPPSIGAKLGAARQGFRPGSCRLVKRSADI